MRTLLWSFMLLCGIGVSAAAGAAEARTAEAARVVEQLHTALIEAMRTVPAADVRARIGRLAPVVEGVFDFPTIGRVILGSAWRGLDPAQQSRFIDAFGELSTATYAARFKGYSGESFRTLGVEPQKQDYQLVKTTLTKAGGDEVTLNYLVRPTTRGWRIVNVVADGVSDLSLKRADYRAVIKAGGFDALVAKLSQQTGAYRDGTATR